MLGDDEPAAGSRFARAGVARIRQSPALLGQHEHLIGGPKPRAGEAGLRKGADGTIRTTYCFRHTYATFRLQMGVDVYFLAEQMGTSVQMIEKHYGHVNTIKHADRVLVGMEGWDPVGTSPDEAIAGGKAKASKAAEARDKTARPASSSPRGQRNRPR